MAAYEKTTAAYNIQPLQNLMRLQRALTGEAKATVAGLLIYPASVGTAVETLRFHFGRPELLVGSQIEKIKQVKQIADDDTQGLIDYATKIRNIQ